jgi:hypothetical protein
LRDVQRNQQENKVIRNIENEAIKRQIKLGEEIENERAMTNRAMRLDNATKLRKTLDEQLATKRKMHQQLKDQDHQILTQGLRQEERQDSQRNDFFNKLKKIQEISMKRVE